MTSEVLILNKKAVVLAADSAATTSASGARPRYSKEADKIFELAQRGAVAVAIYGSASIDGVPWELAIKGFRTHLGPRTFEQVRGYASALLAYLTANDLLFPSDQREHGVTIQFDAAVRRIVDSLHGADPAIFDVSRCLNDRQSAWEVQERILRAALTSAHAESPQQANALLQTLDDLDRWRPQAAKCLNELDLNDVLEVESLIELAHRLRHVKPQWILPTTGLVITGYGEEQIFPAYEHLEIYGHIGHDLAHRQLHGFEITHTCGARIQPLAQRTMMDAFTAGYGMTLADVIRAQSEQSIAAVFEGLAEGGVFVPEQLRARTSSACHSNFMAAWKQLILQRNYSPLIDVLHGLSVGEMAHLAEALIELESLKERFTSPSESVGGPIDVAAISKEQGLIWIKRKHRLDPALNPRHLARVVQTSA